MNASERQLLADRQTRNDARSVLDARLTRLRDAVAERGPAQRLGDEVMGRARSAAIQAAQVASDGRWIFAGLAAVLAAWFARRPLMRGGSALWQKAHPQEPASAAGRLRKWFEQKVKA